MKLTIRWDLQYVRGLDFKEFKDLAKGQYSHYYKNVKNKVIEEEYEFMTGKEVKPKKDK